MSNLEPLIPLLVVGLVALALWLNLDRIRHFFKAKDLLAAHLAQNGFTVHSIHRAKFSAGPFPASGAIGVPVFQVSAHDRNGLQVTGWACCPQPPRSIEVKWAE
jgi:hypothetical protein